LRRSSLLAFTIFSLRAGSGKPDFLRHEASQRSPVWASRVDSVVAADNVFPKAEAPGIALLAPNRIVNADMIAWLSHHCFSFANQGERGAFGSPVCGVVLRLASMRQR
jgi:hypothetical protein